MPKINVMKTIKDSFGTIDPHYDMRCNAIEEIRQESPNLLDMALNCFRFGYMQGMKAESARQRKTSKESETRE